MPCWRSFRRVAVSAVRDATIAATKQHAGAALQAMITDEPDGVGGALVRRSINHREAARLRLTAQAHNDQPENDSSVAADIDDGGSQTPQAHMEFGAVASTRRLCENARQSQAANWRHRRSSRLSTTYRYSPCTSPSANSSIMLRCTERHDCCVTGCGQDQRADLPGVTNRRQIA